MISVFKKLLYDNKRLSQDPPVKQNMIRNFIRRSSEPLNDLRSRKKVNPLTGLSFMLIVSLIVTVEVSDSHSEQFPLSDISRVRGERK